MLMSTDQIAIIGGVLGVFATIVAVVANLFGIGTSLRSLFGERESRGVVKEIVRESSSGSATVIVAGVAGGAAALAVLEAAKRLPDAPGPDMENGPSLDTDIPHGSGSIVSDIVDNL